MRSIPAMLAFLVSALAFCLPTFGAPGWTPVSTSVDSRVVYVSSTGSDANDGLSSATPKQTIAAAYGLMRDGYPDWLLLKAGDVWTDPGNPGLANWRKSGRSTSERMLIGSYGSGTTRPEIRPASGNGFSKGGVPPIRYIYIIGINFNAEPSRIVSDQSSGIAMIGDHDYIHVEDCQIHGFQNNVNINISGGLGIITNIVFKRCMIYNNYANVALTPNQGLFANAVQNLTVEECFFDHCGWDLGKPFGAPQQLSHGVYIQTTCTGTISFQRNIILRSSAHGAQVRTGGTIVGNVFVQNPLGLLVGGGDTPVTGGVTATVTNNLVLEGTDMADASATKGFGIDLKNIATATVTGNIVANKIGTNPSGFALGSLISGPSGVGLNSATVSRNMSFNWPPALNFGDAGQNYGSNTVSNNWVEDRTATANRYLGNNTRGSWAGVTWAANRYWGSLASPFYISSYVAWAVWQAAAGELASTYAAAPSSRTALPTFITALAALSGSAVADIDAASAIYKARGLGVWDSTIWTDALYSYFAGADAAGANTAGFTWYIHSGNTSGGRNGTSAAPYNSIAEWHTAVNGGGTSTSGILGACTLIICSGEGAYFREGPLVLNFGGDSTKSLVVRAWKTGDPTLGGNGGTPQRPVLRGDVVFTTWTLTGGLYASNVLPANVDFVDRVVYRYDDQALWTKEGFRTGAIHVTNGVTNATSAPDGQEFDAAGVPVGLAAGAFAFNRTTRVIWANTPTSTAAADYAYIASGYTAAEKSNALLCFQNVYNSSIEGIEFIGAYEPTAGWYGASMENATNCTIRYNKSVDCSHHGFGFTGSASRNTNCLIEYCEVYGLGGTTGITSGDVYTKRKSSTTRSGAAFFMGNDKGTTSCTVRNCTFHIYGTLNPSGTPLYTTTLQGAFLGSTSRDTANIQTDLVVDGCRFIFYPAYLPTTTNCGPFATWSNSAPTTPTDANTYPVRIKNSQFLNMTGSTMDQGTGGSWAWGAAVSLDNCLLDFSGFATQTARVKYDSVINLSVPNTSTSYVNFSRTLVTAASNNLAGQYTSMFSCNNGANNDRAEVWNLYFDRSAVAFCGGKTPATAYLSMFTFSGGAAGQLGMKVAASRSIFAYQEAMLREASSSYYGLRKLCDGDTNAVAGTEETFTGCGYYNVQDSYYSLKAAYNTWAEFNAAVDTSAVKFSAAPLLGLPQRAMLNRATADREFGPFTDLPESPGTAASTGLGGLRGR